MTEIEHLECEIAEFKLELEQKHQSIHNLNRLLDNAKRKLEYLKRKKLLEKYKPQLDAYVDKYIGDTDGMIPHPFKPELKLFTKGIIHKDLNAILERFKSLKEEGYLIYFHTIIEPSDETDECEWHRTEYFVSYIAFKPDEVLYK